MSKIIFVDKQGNKSELDAPEYGKVTLVIKEGKVVHFEENRTGKMKPIKE